MTKIFVLGATGYIGGDALYTIANVHSDYDIVCLVRNSDKGAPVAAAYPKIRLVYGDLDSFDLIAQEAEKADIVCNWANADHNGAARAILQGLAKHPVGQPGFYIHTSGTGILTIDDVQKGTFGISNARIYDDWDNVAQVTSLPETAPHRDVDITVLSAPETVKTAIVCPPTIYGVGRGPGNQRSIQIPELARVTLQQGHGVIVGEGKAYWTEVHVHDLSQLYLRLVEQAAVGGGAATWGPQGYYFAQSDEFMWGDVAREIAKAAYEAGYVRTAECKNYDPSEVDKLSQYPGSRLWGANSRCRAIRAKKVLGWAPRCKTLKEDIPEAVDVEARSLGLLKGHAAVAAGEV